MWHRVLVLSHWAVVVYVLKLVFPINFDGGGPMPSFYAASMPTPNLSEYYNHRSHYDELFSVPYILVALAMTIMGCFVAPLLRLHLAALRPHAFVGTAGLTLCLLLFLASLSDMGVHFDLWSAPLFLPTYVPETYQVVFLAKLFLLPACLSGLVEITRRALR